jgi:hypothetical protein
MVTEQRIDVLVRYLDQSWLALANHPEATPGWYILFQSPEPGIHPVSFKTAEEARAAVPEAVKQYAADLGGVIVKEINPPPKLM